MKQFLEQNKRRIFLSSAVTVLPMLAGLALWNRLPDQMNIHWGSGGSAAAKYLTVFGVPLLLLATHWICMLFTAADPKNRRQHPKAIGLIFWIAPMVSLAACGLLYSIAFGRELNAECLLVIPMALLFLIIGNYLPKIRQNSTLGIKVYWALWSEENWNMTHRFSGRLWVLGGAAILVSMLFPGDFYLIVMFVAIIILAFAPVLYSWLYFRKQRKAGTGSMEKPPVTPAQKKATTFSAVFVGVILIFVLVMLFTGDIGFQMGTDSLTVEASYYPDLTVRYSQMESMELRTEPVPGSRTNGFGSPRLLMGMFANEEFGSYTRYTYTESPAVIVIYNASGKALVLGCETASETQALYEQLLAKLPN